ncbi:MAG: nitroreductase family protein [Planctomycetota bacterium]
MSDTAADRDARAQGPSSTAAPSYAPPPAEAPHVPLDRYVPPGRAEDEARAFYERMDKRRTVRMFSDQPVSRETIEWVIRAASTAPSGAHKQPWRFVAISSAEMKSKIRVAAEEEEREFYERRASDRWLDDLKPFGTNPDKRFLEIAPWLVVVMALKKTDDGGQVYYLNESVGIATGMLLTAAHHAGLATLTHTPSPMKFLAEVLGRPDNEKPFLLVPMGYPTADCVVPELGRKALDEVSAFVE